VKTAGPFLFIGKRSMADEHDAAESSPTTSPAEVAQLEERVGQDALSFLEGRFNPTDPTDDDPTDTVDVEDESSASPSAPAATGPQGAGDAAPLPASWEPDEVALQLGQELGVSDEVVRGFKSGEEFWRAVALARNSQQQRAADPPASPSSPTPPSKEPSALEKFVADELQDPDVRAAFKELLDQKHTEYTTRQQQEAQERARLEYFQRFEKSLDEFGSDLFGASDKLSEANKQARGTMWDTLLRMQQAGLVKTLDRAAVERAFAFAFPAESQQQTRRQQFDAAKKQAKQRLGVGGTTGQPRTPPVKDPRQDPELRATFERMAKANA
jgi:hypothetical protein